VTVLVGGIYELFQSDLDLGRLAVERLRAEQLGADVLVEDLHYGAVAVVQRLEELRPDALVLVTAVRRDRAPGSVERRRVDPQPVHPQDFQAAIGDAVTGYVHIDLLLEVASGFEALPPRTVTVEVEPKETGSGEGLSTPAAAGLEVAIELVRAEVRRAPLLALADQLGPLVAGDRLEDSTALAALRELLGELRHLDREGRWGRTFALRDRFRLAIAGAVGSEGMDHRDWALWWALIEELDRIEAVEALPEPRPARLRR
jgi:hydrogenase maturation protease